MDNWISVKDKTPQENGYYIVFNGHPVTHWQPFPSPPHE